MKFLKEDHKTIEDKNTAGIIFITLGLEGALADEAVLNMKNELDLEIQQAQIEGQNDYRIRRIKKVYFSKIDALLDTSSIGPQWLRKYDLAKLIIGELEVLEGQNIKLVCYTVMPNHVHLVFEPVEKINESVISESIELFKLKTRDKANEILGIEGEFWIQDHHIHFIHDSTELINIISYILENPVKAGLVDYWRDWPWTYCNPDYI
jgi:putative transposase